MVNKKQIKSRGKIPLSKYFQKFENNDSVSVVKELSVRSSFPLRMQGRTGNVEGKRGRAYIVKIKDSNMEKRYIIEPVHLRKIKLVK